MPHSSGFTRAQRAYLRKLADEQRQKIRDETALLLRDVLNEEAQLLFLRAMTHGQESQQS